MICVTMGQAIGRIIKDQWIDRRGVIQNSPGPWDGKHILCIIWHHLLWSTALLALVPVHWEPNHVGCAPLLLPISSHAFHHPGICLCPVIRKSVLQHCPRKLARKRDVCFASACTLVRTVVRIKRTMRICRAEHHTSTRWHRKHRHGASNTARMPTKSVQCRTFKKRHTSEE